MRYIKPFGILLFIVSLIFLGMGLIHPFMTFKIDIQMDGGGIVGAFFGNSIAEKFNKTVSYNIPQAMEMLFKYEMYFVSILIGLFAVVIPTIKTILTLIFLFNGKKSLYKTATFIGKFAMADVFCVGIIIAFLYTSFNKVLTANLEVGFYYFATYVILNIIAMLLIKPIKKERHE